MFGNVKLLLNVDAYFNFLLGGPNTLILKSVGQLDRSGKARATFSLPRGLPLSLIGTRLFPAYLTVQATPFSIDYASNPVRLTLVR